MKRVGVGGMVPNLAEEDAWSPGSSLNFLGFTPPPGAQRERRT